MQGGARGDCGAPGRLRTIPELHGWTGTHSVDMGNPTHIPRVHRCIAETVRRDGAPGRRHLEDVLPDHGRRYPRPSLRPIYDRYLKGASEVDGGLSDGDRVAPAGTRHGRQNHDERRLDIDDTKPEDP